MKETHFSCLYSKSNIFLHYPKLTIGMIQIRLEHGSTGISTGLSSCFAPSSLQQSGTMHKLLLMPCQFTCQSHSLFYPHLWRRPRDTETCSQPKGNNQPVSWQRTVSSDLEVLSLIPAIATAIETQTKDLVWNGRKCLMKQKEPHWWLWGPACALRSCPWKSQTESMLRDNPDGGQHELERGLTFYRKLPDWMGSHVPSTSPVQSILWRSAFLFIVM